MRQSRLKENFTRTVRVKVADLGFPSLKVRPTQTGGTESDQFVTQFAAGNYGVGGRFISVGIDPTCKGVCGRGRASLGKSSREDRGRPNGLEERQKCSSSTALIA